MKRPICPKVPEGTTRIIRPENDVDLVFPAALLACGELVAFPTETVYGLGADAKNPEAVANIFKAKGRPADNPLIVHVARKSDIQNLVVEITPLAQCLMDAFMPGPITLVMKKSDTIPDLVSAGLDTVGIRMPSHPVAQKLILMSGVAVAAPSANISGSPSPTRAEHVVKDLEGRIPCIVDGGPCEVGLESTVVEVTGAWPVILRPGAVTIEMITAACRDAGISARGDTLETHDHVDEGEAPRAPGMKYRHYAPRAAVSVVMPGANGCANSCAEGCAEAFLAEATDILTSFDKETLGIFCGREDAEFLKTNLPAESLPHVFFYIFGENMDIDGAARGLFDGVRLLDNEGAHRILAAGFVGEGLEKAYMNRLEKAAGEKKELDPLEISASSKGRKILFVCTGNTCRSPMAEAIYNVLASRRGPFAGAGAVPAAPIVTEDPFVQAVPVVPAEPLITASSAGIYADNGSPAAAFAADAVRIRFGADLSGHEARKVTEEIIAENDLIIAMTREHAVLLRRFSPAFSGKIFSFSEYFEEKSITMGAAGNSSPIPDVPDPFGQSSGVYLRTAQYLHDLIQGMWKPILTDMGMEETQ